MDQRILAILRQLLDQQLSRRDAVEQIGRVIAEIRGQVGDVFVNDAETIINDYTTTFEDFEGYEAHVPKAEFAALYPMRGALGTQPAAGIDETVATARTESDYYGPGALEGLPVPPVTPTPTATPVPTVMPFPTATPVPTPTPLPLPRGGGLPTPTPFDAGFDPSVLPLEEHEAGAGYTPNLPALTFQEQVTGKDLYETDPVLESGVQWPVDFDITQTEALQKQTQPEQFAQWLTSQPWARQLPLAQAAARLSPGIRTMFDMQFPGGVTPGGALPASEPRAFMNFLRGNIGGRFDRPAAMDRLNLIQTLLNQPDLATAATNPYIDAGGWGAERNRMLQEAYQSPGQQYDAFNLAATMGMGPRARTLMGNVYGRAYNQFQAKNPFGNFLNWARERNLGGWGDPSEQARIGGV
jgi:hypothetical protein